MPSISLEFLVHGKDGAEQRNIEIDKMVIAGWTGRDKKALEKHIVELEELGVKRPATTPIYYRGSASRLTTAGVIEATGGNSSGEVEFVIVTSGGKSYVGVGSDHTDRAVEVYNITVSKQMCDKPVAPELWPFDDVLDHWDSLELRSWIIENGEKVLYQEGSVATMLPPAEIMRQYNGPTLGDGSVLFCGTLAAKGGIRPAGRIEYEIFDPVLDRRISHGYDIVELPNVG